MTTLRLFQVDAFADHLFAGNPAAVVPLDAWLPDATLAAIALENNLSETAFFVPDDGAADYHLRWFTPAVEVDLCGHATLGAAHVLRHHDPRPWTGSVTFASRSGPLGVRADGELLELDFPSVPARPGEVTEDVVRALGRRPREVHAGPATGADHLRTLVILEDEAAVAALRPDIAAVARLPGGCLLVTAPGEAVDFVSRFFAPGAGVAEDPVTGSAHCVLAPFWAERLGKPTLVGRQISARGGTVRCRVAGERVHLAGRAVTYLEGTIRV